jgi:hypothetical protein
MKDCVMQLRRTFNSTTASIDLLAAEAFAAGQKDVAEAYRRCFGLVREGIKQAESNIDDKSSTGSFLDLLYKTTTYDNSGDIVNSHIFNIRDFVSEAFENAVFDFESQLVCELRENHNCSEKDIEDNSMDISNFARQEVIDHFNLAEIPYE